MEPFGLNRLFRATGCVSLSILAATFMLQPVRTNAQTLPSGSNQAKPLDPNDPSVLRPLNQDTSILSFVGGQRLMEGASKAVSAQNYPLATKKLQEARQVFNQLSGFYQSLANNFSGIDVRISDSTRRKALETAQMRDEATYQLALVHRAQSQPELAIPLLVQIVNSQQPTRELGKKAYQQLFEVGFVEFPYPNNGSEQPSSLNPDTNILSLAGGQRLMEEASKAVSAQKYSLATKKLQEARQVFNQVSGLYQSLANSFSGIDTRISDSTRRKALETAQIRDEATYQLALVHRAQNQSELAVPLLIQIVNSQQPTRELGKKAYQQLFELGFVDSRFPRDSAGQPSSSSSR